MDFSIDPTTVDTEQLDADIANRDAQVERREQLAAYDEAQRVQEEQAAQQREEERQANSTNVVTETFNAVAGGLSDAANDLVTAPERLIDMFNGEMAEQGENYRPDWLGGWYSNADDMFQTNHWASSLTRGVINAATLLIPVGGLVKGGSMVIKGTGMGARALSATSKAPRVVQAIGQGAVYGAGVDLLLSDSQKQNASQMLIEHFPALGNVLGPLATQDTDHPAIKTIKNVVEGMGIGAVVDLVPLITKGVLGNVDVRARNADIREQIVEAGTEQLSIPGLGGYKNNNITDSHQGAPISRSSPGKVYEQLNLIDTDISAARGSTDSIMTPAQATRSATTSQLADDETAKLAKSLLSDDQLKDIMENPDFKRQTLDEILKPAYRRMQEVVDGRMGDPNLSADEFWEPILSQPKGFTGERFGADPLDYISSNNVVASDLVIGSLLKEVRDRAIVAKELMNEKDILAKDGPMQVLRDRLIVGLYNVKKSRAIISGQLKGLDPNGPGFKTTSKSPTPGPSPKPKEVEVKPAEVVESVDKDLTDLIQDTRPPLPTPSTTNIDPRTALIDWDPGAREGSIIAEGLKRNLIKQTDVDNYFRTTQFTSGKKGRVFMAGIVDEPVSNISELTDNYIKDSLDSLREAKKFNKRYSQIESVLGIKNPSVDDINQLFKRIYINTKIHGAVTLFSGRSTPDKISEFIKESLSHIDPRSDGLHYLTTGELPREYGDTVRDRVAGSFFKPKPSEMDQLLALAKEDLSDILPKSVREEIPAVVKTVEPEVEVIQPKKVEVQAELEQIHADTKTSVDSMMQIVSKTENEDLLKAVVEAFSMSNNVNNMTDLDNFLKTKLRGGTFNGKQHTSVLIKELQGVMINSILSGPKTPARALLGTGMGASTRYLSQTLGAAIRAPLSGDTQTLKASMSATMSLVEMIPESFKVFRENVASRFSNDIATNKSRFLNYEKNDQQWQLMSNFVERNGTLGEKAVFTFANIARGFNSNRLFTYSSRLMGAVDDTFRHIMGRARAKELAIRKVLDETGSLKIGTEELAKIQDEFYGQLFDQDGNITDKVLKQAYGEVTLTNELDPFMKGLENTMSMNPWTKPFFLFARTGVNGLGMTINSAPGLNLLRQKYRKILMADPKNADHMAELGAKYGIESPEQLANEKSLFIGRQTIGLGVVIMATQAWMSGNLRGNGPANRQQLNTWRDAGWRANEIKIGDTWVSFQSLEPFNQILSLVADISDLSQVMGPEWTESRLQTVGLTLATSLVSKSYLEGIGQLVDLFGQETYKFQSIIGNLLNNTVPLAGLRNDMGRLITPYARELGSDITDSIRNRNLGTEPLGDPSLAIKYDIFNGQPIRDWDVPNRLFNMFSPITFNNDVTPGRQLIFDSNYDLRSSVMTAPDGTSLRDSPLLRSMFQREMGRQGLEDALDKLATDPSIIASMQAMESDLNSGLRHINPMDYEHNRRIKQLMDNARRRAWATVRQSEEAQPVIEEQRLRDLDSTRAGMTRYNVDQILDQTPTR